MQVQAGRDASSYHDGRSCSTNRDLLSLSAESVVPVSHVIELPIMAEQPDSSQVVGDGPLPNEVVVAVCGVMRGTIL